MRYFRILSVLLVVGCIDTHRDRTNPHVEPTPNPTVDPQPPKPDEITPTPGKIRVLILEETEDRNNPEMRDCLRALKSPKIRTYLDSHCEPVGTTDRGWLMIDKDNDLRHADPYWQEALKLPRDSVPWMYITNGKQGTSGPFSCDEEENLEILRKWGGP